MDIIARKILIIDDDYATRNMYVDIFKKNRFDVEEAIDGLEGLNKLKYFKADVIFTGIVMPNMDGFTLIQELKKDPTTANIPVVISSHMGREEDRIRANELGAKDFISRDLNTPNDVVEKIRSVFNLTEYELKFDVKELDAPKLIKDMYQRQGYECSDCGGRLNLILIPENIAKHAYNAKFRCAQCGKDQK